MTISSPKKLNAARSSVHAAAPILCAAVNEKLAHIEDAVAAALRLSETDLGMREVFSTCPGRDVQVRAIHELPGKLGLASRSGQARLLHDLASIELQAMELSLRSLIEFPEQSPAFRQELARLTLEESEHLRLCLRALDDLGEPWGTYPVHIGLWQSVSASDCILDRLVIVHRYLEGSGLDASETLMRRLTGVRAREVTEAVKVIQRDEVGHVQFGSRWYQKIARDQGLDPDVDFGQRLSRHFQRLPRRLEPIAIETRRAAGFSDQEIASLQLLQVRWREVSQVSPV